jgi:hypothetical protein
MKKINSNYKEDLAILASRPEFKALENLMRIEENNIVVQTFKTNSSDPDLARKKAHLEGRMYELRKIRRTFKDVLKGNES